MPQICQVTWAKCDWKLCAVAKKRLESNDFEDAAVAETGTRSCEGARLSVKKPLATGSHSMI